MTHQEAQSREMGEAYVRARLTQAEREAFEEHYFSCDECFEEVQSLERLRAGVIGAVEGGAFPVEPERRRWGFALPLAVAASVVLALTNAYLLLVREPPSQSRERAALAEAQSQTLHAQARITELENALRSASPQAGALPVLVLEVARAGTVDRIVLAPGATQLALWMDPAPGANGPFRVEIRRETGVIANLSGLARNAQGAIAVTVPAREQAPGDYRARLYSGSTLIHEYAYRIDR